MTEAFAERVVRIVAEQLGLPDSEVKPRHALIADLGADSLDTIELVMEFECEWCCEIPDHDAERIVTVQDIIDYGRARGATATSVSEQSSAGSGKEAAGAPEQDHPKGGGTKEGATPASAERAWLIESATFAGPRWWGFNWEPSRFDDWCQDANKAVRFARREDAEAVRLFLIDKDGFKGHHPREKMITVTEHEWLVAASPVDPAPASAATTAEALAIFDRWAISEGMDTSNDDDGFISQRTQAAWDGWCAARASAPVAPAPASAVPADKPGTVTIYMRRDPESGELMPYTAEELADAGLVAPSAPVAPGVAQDAARLDGLEAANANEQWIVAKGEAGFTVWLGTRRHATRPTLRAAIDAAMSVEPTNKEPQ